MDLDSSSPKLDPKLKAPIRACKTRKVVQTEKSVIRMRIGENVGKLKNQGPPSDSWSWRKYGQKAIKGSPYPRGYYRCTSKGCSAKKQVERSKTDASVLVITYTFAHNHPCPSLQGSRATQQPKERPKSLKQENRAEEASHEDQHADISFENLLKTSVRGSAQGIIMNKEGPFSENIDNSHDITLGFVLDEEPMIPCPHHHLMKSLTPNSEGNDIFDELEEL